MMTIQYLEAHIARVEYPGFTFHVNTLGDGFYVQVQFDAKDNADGTVDRAWHGRKWYISSHATDSEIVLTCLKAVITALEHEAREKFTFSGIALFHPHVDVLLLAEVAHSRMLRS